MVNDKQQCRALVARFEQNRSKQRPFLEVEWFEDSPNNPSFENLIAWIVFNSNNIQELISTG